MEALVFQTASLADVHWSMSGDVILMVLIGGMGTVFGPVIGATVLVVLQNYLASFGSMITIIQGVVFVCAVLLFREGVAGVLSRYLFKSSQLTTNLQQIIRQVRVKKG
jgi:branched-chain amino acid transport system permease protein